VEINKWVSGYQTIAEGIWNGINNSVKQFKETETSYEAHLLWGEVHRLNKSDMNKIEKFIEDDDDLEFLFGIEKQMGVCTEIIMDFSSKKYGLCRIDVSYGLEGKEEIYLCVWASNLYQKAVELAKEVTAILLERDNIRLQHVTGEITYKYGGNSVVNKNNCKF
jgi:hypothetical protein